MKQRLDYIDLTKLISIVLIIISHTNMLPTIVSNSLCSFYIVVFFICSGITFKTDNLSKKGYLSNYLLKLIKYYLFYSLCLVFAYNLLSIVTGAFTFDSLKNGIVGILYSRYTYNRGSDVVLLNSGNAPMWFLTCYMVSYSFFFYLMKFVSKRKSAWGTLLIILGFVISYIMSIPSLLLPWSIDVVPYMLSFMFMGYYIKDYDLSKKRNYAYLITMITIFLFFSSLSEGINLSIKNYGNIFIMTIIMGIIGSLIIIYSSYLVSKVVGNSTGIVRKIYNYLCNISKNTIDIMCYHLMVLFIIGLIISNPVMYIVISVVIILIISPIVNYLVKMIIRI